MAGYFKKSLQRSRHHLASYITNMLKRIRNVLQVTPKYQLVSSPCKLLEEDVATYQEHLANYLKKNLQISGTSCKSRTEDVTTYQEHLQIIWGRIYKYQEHLASYLKKMLQRIRVYQERLATYLQKTLQRRFWSWDVSFQSLFHTLSRSAPLMATGCVLASARALAIQCKPALNRCTTRMSRR